MEYEATGTRLHVFPNDRPCMSKLRRNTVKKERAEIDDREGNQKRIVARREDILKGFQVNWLNIRDADTGKVLWQVYSDISVSNLEIKAKVPKQIFECRAVLTQINFSSVEPLERFRREETRRGHDTSTTQSTLSVNTRSSNEFIHATTGCATLQEIFRQRGDKFYKRAREVEDNAIIRRLGQYDPHETRRYKKPRLK
uniref:GMP phosphodiesterase delta subunit domain-containing protein n=1 Tax=Timema monikensis TaxID=170555 RepID=A0A7R9E0L2_9NEOP|nr:unnamed protein product [Timema monikensis]